MKKDNLLSNVERTIVICLAPRLKGQFSEGKNITKIACERKKQYISYNIQIMTLQSGSRDPKHIFVSTSEAWFHKRFSAYATKQSSSRGRGGCVWKHPASTWDTKCRKTPEQDMFRNVKCVVDNRVYSAPCTANRLDGDTQSGDPSCLELCEINCA